MPRKNEEGKTYRWVQDDPSKREDTRDVFDKVFDEGSFAPPDPSDSDEARARRGQQSHEQERFMENALVSGLGALAGRAAMKRSYYKTVKPTHSFKEQARIAGVASNIAGAGAGMLAGGIHYNMTKDNKKPRK